MKSNECNLKDLIIGNKVWVINEGELKESTILGVKCSFSSEIRKGSGVIRIDYGESYSFFEIKINGKIATSFNLNNLKTDDEILVIGSDWFLFYSELAQKSLKAIVQEKLLEMEQKHKKERALFHKTYSSLK